MLKARTRTVEKKRMSSDPKMDVEEKERRRAMMGSGGGRMSATVSTMQTSGGSARSPPVRTVGDPIYRPDADPMAGHGPPGAELQRLQLEWQQLELRRSRLSERGSTTAVLERSESGSHRTSRVSSHLSVSALLPAASAGASPTRRAGASPTRPQADRRSGLEPRSPRAQEAMEKEREALRAALHNRSRGGPLGASSLNQRRALSPSKSGVDDSRPREERERDRAREREKEWTERLRVLEEDKHQMQAQLEEREAHSLILQKKLDDKQREETELRAGLQRVEAEAKHKNEM